MYPSVSRALAVCVVLFLAHHFVSCDTQPKKPAPSGFSDNDFTHKLRSALQPFDTANKKIFRSIGDDVRFIYQADDYQPIWVKHNYKPVNASERIIEELEDTYWDGLDTARYQLARLKDLRIKLDTTKVNNVRDAIAFDTLLTHNYLLAARELLIGKISPKKVDSLWYCPNDSVWNAPQLLISGKKDYPSLSTYRSEVPTYKLLREEYKRFKELSNDSAFLQAIESIEYVKHPDSDMLYNIFDVIGYEMPWLETIPDDSVSELKQLYFAYQAYRCIPQTGKLDSITLASLATPVDTFLQKISINMERTRWMQRQFSELYLIVNVSLMEMFLRRADTNAMHMRVVVGKPERQTPSLSATMANVVINPPWGVPPTILKKDVLPGLQKSGSKYLNKKGLRVYDQEGKRIQASAINAKNYRRYNYKQAPGDDNALGYVKFNLPNKWDIYLHDTPHREDFVKRFRALSSGCIRLQRPLDLAMYVLSDLEGKRYTPGRIDTVIKTHKTRWEVLKNKIPVHITYLTAFEDTTGKHIQFPRDIYHRDDKLMALLN